MGHATPLPWKGPLGNHRYLGKTDSAIVELIPALKPGTWHVTVFGPGRISTAVRPVAVGGLVAELATCGINGQPIRWQKRWHRPMDANPHLRLGGKVYAIGAETGMVKIGTSIDMIDRLKNLRATSPCKLELLLIFDGGVLVERALHCKLKTHHDHGEWFRPDPAVLAALNRCCTAHGLYALVAKLVPWESEGGPEEWEKLKKGRPVSTGAWASLRRAGLDGRAV